jgi:arginase
MSLDRIVLIGVPLALGGCHAGTSMGAQALRMAGIQARLHGLGWEVSDLGDVDVDAGDGGVEIPGLRHLHAIRVVCERLRDRVLEALERGAVPVVMGGDHSIAMGTIAGLTRYHAASARKPGLVWLDAHGDINTAQTSPSGNIHGMPLAVALGLGCSDLVHLANTHRMIDGACAALVGLRDLDRDEARNLDLTGLKVFTMRDIDERGMRAVMTEAIERALAGTSGIHVSIDMDALDPSTAPGVATPCPGGLTFREARLAMELLADTGKVLSVDVVEINPIHDHGNRTAALAVELVAALMGGKIQVPCRA